MIQITARLEENRKMQECRSNSFLSDFEPFRAVEVLSRRDFLTSPIALLGELGLPTTGRVGGHSSDSSGQLAVVVIFSGVRRGETFSPRSRTRFQTKRVVSEVNYLKAKAAPTSFHWTYSFADSARMSMNKSLLEGGPHLLDEGGSQFRRKWGCLRFSRQVYA